MSQPPTSAETDSLSRRQIVLLVAALVFSLMSFSLNATMLAPAVRDINDTLGPGAFVAMSTPFYLAGALANVVLIRWSDYIGRKRVLIGIVVVMCIGTALCLSTSLPIVVVGRFLQGTSNITYGLAFLVLRARLSGGTFGVCCGVMASINGGVAGGDAFLAGIMTDAFGYRSIFALILVVGLIAVAFVWKWVPADEVARAEGRMDWVGAVFIGLTVGGITMFLSNGGHQGWASAPALIWLTAAVAGFLALVVVDRRVAHPLIALKHMRSREAWPLLVVTILVMGSFMVVLGFIVPAMAEDLDSGFGLNATTTALLFLTPGAVVQVITAPFIGRLAVRIGFVTVLRAGIVATIVVVALTAVFADHKYVVAALMVVFGFTCTAVILTPLSSLGVLQASDEAPGALPGIANASYGIGFTLGFAWAGPIVGSGTNFTFQHAFWIAVGIGVVALVFSLILRPKPLTTGTAAPAGSTAHQTSP
ncbi:MFS transporter [Mycolicibacterium aromaticivorans JS19b1 = JCM 16368]|uniref:MFS transporter n=1 Tax=Mycolicibacterium aromaticivorans JS19b1 = JCM 16368 TaxID=1440774 RepID=A0A064CKM1_9MYCO|nr:MFS transporter [Mycolicibacterium aromaticivorans]KDF01150.1 MFS transporter [Mycolicibacterium aromaticivorans JS19b1 = JCM 16368]